eukprot:3726693-Rhodomonas_salina.1
MVHEFVPSVVVSTRGSCSEITRFLAARSIGCRCIIARLEIACTRVPTGRRSRLPILPGFDDTWVARTQYTSIVSDYGPVQSTVVSYHATGYGGTVRYVDVLQVDFTEGGINPRLQVPGYPGRNPTPGKFAPE